MTYKKQGKGTHLTLEDRRDIQHGLDEGLSRAQIARQIGKSPSTVSKEIKLHRQFKLTSAYGRNPGSYCVHKGSKPLCRRCNIECEDYLERVCERREHYGVCNKCPRNSNCHLDKYFYRASKAHGLIPMVDVIYTFDGIDGSFNSSYINDVISLFLL